MKNRFDWKTHRQPNDSNSFDQQQIRWHVACLAHVSLLYRPIVPVAHGKIPI